VIELYAVTDQSPGPLPELAPLRVLASGRLAVVYGPTAEDDVSAEALWRHEDIVEALMDRRDVLPFRYGTRCEDEGAAARAVAEREEELSAALDRVRGAVELSVRAVTTETTQEPPGDESAAAYVAAKAAAAATARAVVEAVHEPLRALARASQHKPSGALSEPLRAAYLVDRPRVDGFAAEVALLQARHPDLRLLCTGPWPPYSFVER
jgi:hypothetical protein